MELGANGYTTCEVLEQQQQLNKASVIIRTRRNYSYKMLTMDYCCALHNAVASRLMYCCSLRKEKSSD